MKIILTTVREFPDHLYPEWISIQRMGLPWLDPRTLAIDGKQSFTSSGHITPTEITKATTTVEIVKEES